MAYVLAVQLAIPWFGQSAETLAFANSIQLIVHMVMMAILCHRLFDLRGLAITTTMAGCVMAAAVTWCLVQAALVVLPPMSGLLQLVWVAPTTGIIYVVIAQLLGITPVRYATTLLWNRVRTMLGRRAAQP
jgi:peptidoglycan biosynthesis protein MviN/MurJ (putative lipid II flippase)